MSDQSAEDIQNIASKAKAAAEDVPQELTIRVPIGKIASTARQVLPKDGLPKYAGIGALAVIGLIDWPVAAAAGAGYALARLTSRPGPQPPSAPQSPRTSPATPRPAPPSV
jgi:hypothetical protein